MRQKNPFYAQDVHLVRKNRPITSVHEQDSRAQYYMKHSTLNRRKELEVVL
jgi:hypothetical protein